MDECCGSCCGACAADAPTTVAELHFDHVDPELFEILTGMAIAERYIGASDSLGMVTFAAGAAIAAKVSCLECGGTGWWGYGPTPGACGPCVPCKGTGLVWIGL